MGHTDQDVLNAVLRNDFMAFVHRCMLTLNPGTPFQQNWHHEAIAHALGRVRTGEVTRLVINAPPRSLKSIIASVALPAHMLGLDPRQKIFCISYGTDLAAKHAGDFRSIVQSGWYRRAFPKMQVSRCADFDTYTTSHGYRRTTSINAAITGLGGDCFIVDDQQKATDAQSDALRNHVNDWFYGTLHSRLDDKKTGSIVLVMQRMHCMI